MPFGASKKSVSPIVKKAAPRKARALPTANSVNGPMMGAYPRGTMRQSNGLKSVSTIQRNPRFKADPADPTPG